MIEKHNYKTEGLKFCLRFRYNTHNCIIILRQPERSYPTKHKSNMPVTKQPYPYTRSMPFLAYTGNSGQGSSDKNRDTSPLNKTDVPANDQNPASGGCYFVCCDNCCSCDSTHETSPSAKCCYLWKVIYCPFIIKLVLFALVVVLLIEFLYRRADQFIDNTVAEVRKIDVTTTTKLVKR